MLISALKVSDAPWFKEKNVTDFPKAFNNMCDDYDVRQTGQLKKIS